METIGRYEILGELGRGGCGIVYRALDPSIGRSVAIKTIRLDSDSAELRERFRREARSAADRSASQHSKFIHGGSTEAGDLMFIAMEYIDGQTLAQLMREVLLPVEFTLGTLRAAADALDFAHAHNIVHRDVKPANFLITSHGQLKMADFGIAKLMDGDVGLTNTGMVVGTARYMSPEQIGAKEVTGRSDQFSLAVIAYEMLTGRRPFQGDSWPSIMHAIIANEPPPLSQYQKELGDDVTAALRKGLAKDPHNRYPTCKAFALALEVSILGSTSGTSTPSHGQRTVGSVAGQGRARKQRRCRRRLLQGGRKYAAQRGQLSRQRLPRVRRPHQPPPGKSCRLVRRVPRRRDRGRCPS